MITEEKMDDSIYNEPYVVKNGCLYEMTTMKEQTIPVKLADFVPTLSAEVTRDDGTEMQKFFRVSGVHRTGAILPEVLVSAEEMQSMKWLLAKWGTLGAAQPRHNALSIVCTQCQVKRESMKPFV